LRLGCRCGQLLDAVGFRTPHTPLRAAGETVLASLVSLACLAVGLRILGQSLPHEVTAADALFFVLQWAVVAVGEETLYRGVLQRRLTGATGLGPGILLASGLWAFVGHIRAPAIENMVFRLPQGIILGCLYARSKSLYPPIFAHWALNLAALSGV